MRKPTYTVGYGKPPKYSRFKPGQSGNPKGRPKGAREFSVELAEEMKQMISVTEGGRTRKVSKQRAMIKALFAKALRGDCKAAQLIVGHSKLFTGRAELPPRELEQFDQLILEDYARRNKRGGK
ncbi:MAG: DUF5681 domain-containing protein [Hyphomicrobium sp.]|uniref:DUF5681 domain-containing protein n=1 Tax=Hyphomicrobium sp. TaxID=82 RepID=UPI0039E55E5C